MFSWVMFNYDENPFNVSLIFEIVVFIFAVMVLSVEFMSSLVGLVIILGVSVPFVGRAERLIRYSFCSVACTSLIVLLSMC